MSSFWFSSLPYVYPMRTIVMKKCFPYKSCAVNACAESFFEPYRRLLPRPSLAVLHHLGWRKTKLTWCKGKVPTVCCCMKTGESRKAWWFSGYKNLSVHPWIVIFVGRSFSSLRRIHSLVVASTINHLSFQSRILFGTEPARSHHCFRFGRWQKIGDEQ